MTRAMSRIVLTAVAGALLTVGVGLILHFGFGIDHPSPLLAVGCGLLAGASFPLLKGPDRGNSTRD